LLRRLLAPRLALPGGAGHRAGGRRAARVVLPVLALRVVGQIVVAIVLLTADLGGDRARRRSACRAACPSTARAATRRRLGGRRAAGRRRDRAALRLVLLDLRRALTLQWRDDRVRAHDHGSEHDDGGSEQSTSTHGDLLDEVFVAARIASFPRAWKSPPPEDDPCPRPLARSS
jgi:hypothetical protein